MAKEAWVGRLQRAAVILVLLCGLLLAVIGIGAPMLKSSGVEAPPVAPAGQN